MKNLLNTLLIFGKNFIRISKIPVAFFIVGLFPVLAQIIYFANREGFAVAVFIISAIALLMLVIVIFLFFTNRCTIKDDFFNKFKKSCENKFTYLAHNRITKDTTNDNCHIVLISISSMVKKIFDQHIESENLINFFSKKEIKAMNDKMNKMIIINLTNILNQLPSQFLNQCPMVKGIITKENKKHENKGHEDEEVTDFTEFLIENNFGCIMKLNDTKDPKNTFFWDETIDESNCLFATFQDISNISKKPMDKFYDINFNNVTYVEYLGNQRVKIFISKNGQKPKTIIVSQYEWFIKSNIGGREISEIKKSFPGFSNE